MKSFLNSGAFLARSAKNRAIRSNLFYRFAVKKDFRSYPLRGRHTGGLKAARRTSRTGEVSVRRAALPENERRAFARVFLARGAAAGW
jgi:hypothetical protein